MSGSAMWSVQTAIYGRLTGDSTLMALLPGGVNDHLPTPTAFPYIVLGEMIETPFRTFGKNGHETVPTLRIWGDALGYKKIKDIYDRVTTLLEGTPLTVAGHGTVLVNFEDAQAVPDFADDNTELRQIVAHYRIITQDS